MGDLEGKTLKLRQRSNQTMKPNGPIARKLQRACHQSRPLLISFSLDVVRALSVGIAVLLVGCATRTEFDTLYEYYFPKHGEYVNSSVYRRSFDETLFGP